MFIYIFLTISVLLISLLVKDNCIKGTRQYVLNRVAIAAVFVLLFSVSALRVAVGNDYWPYMFNFELIAQNRFKSVAFESGFNLIVKIIQFLTNDAAYIPIFAVFSFFTVLFFLKALREQSEWFIFSLFLLMTNGYYFSSLNSIRYYFTFALALWSMRFVIEKRYTEFIVTVLLGALIHKSILVVIPVYLICNIKWNKVWVASVTAFAASLPICKNLYRKIIFVFYPYYEGTYLDDFQISYVNILKAVAIVVFCLIFYKSSIKDNRKYRFYFNLNYAALLVYTCCSFMPEYTRIGYYFAGSQMFLVPYVLRNIENKELRRFFEIAIVLCFTAYFAFFLKTCYETNIRLLPYMSWVFT